MDKKTGKNTPGMVQKITTSIKAKFTYQPRFNKGRNIDYNINDNYDQDRIGG